MREQEIINKYDVPFMEELPAQLGLNFDAIIHASMEIFGVAERWRRSPYMNASDEQMAVIGEFLKRLSII